VSTARRLAGTQRDAAEAAIHSVLDAPVGENAQKSARDALDWLAKFEGCITNWTYCGPYTRTGKGSNALADVAFPPEPGAPAMLEDSTGPATPEWKPLTTFQADNPWIADFTPIDKGVSRCIYVRTTIISESEQPARLEIGSDDGVVVWLNNELLERK